jgi:hypothetical protein
VIQSGRHTFRAKCANASEPKTGSSTGIIALPRQSSGNPSSLTPFAVVRGTSVTLQAGGLIDPGVGILVRTGNRVWRPEQHSDGQRDHDTGEDFAQYDVRNLCHERRSDEYSRQTSDDEETELHRVKIADDTRLVPYCPDYRDGNHEGETHPLR